MITVIGLLVLIAFGLTVLAWAGRAPLTAAVFVLCIIEALSVLPLGK